jgi:protein-disulfide isomerase
MHPNAVPHTKQILCSNNPSKALFDIMVNRQGLAAGSASCQSKVDKQLTSIAEFTRNNGINSTPYIITDTNQVIGGFNVPAIQKFMETK